MVTSTVAAAAPAKAPRLPITDGLRAVAVVAVVLFHIFPGFARGGFVGVDIFFVISGFVIALNYLPALVARKTTFRRFFIRRIQRLVPAYFLLLLVTTAIAYVALRPHELASFGASLSAQALYLQNVVFWVQGDYFLKAETKPLLHTWSLAVEEQFYLLFPLLILLLRRSSTSALVAAIVLVFLSFAVGSIAAHSSPKTAFYWLPTRIWEFMAGIGTAIVYLRSGYARLSVRLGNALFLTALATMIGTVFLFDDTAVFPSLQALLAVAATVVILFVQERVRTPAVLVTNGVAQQFGRISYSWYLWHWPIVTFFFVVADRRPHPGEGVACLALGYILALLSFRFVEKAGQRVLARRPDRASVGVLAAFLAFALLAGAYLVASKGALDRYAEPMRSLYATAAETHPGRCSLSQRIRYYDAEVCRLNDVAGPGGLLIIGDSHAAAVKDEVAALGQSAGVPVYFTKMNCTIVGYGAPGFCSETRWRDTKRDIRRFGINKVLSISFWTPEITQAKYEAAIARILTAVPRLYFEKAIPFGAYFAPNNRADAIAEGRSVQDHGYDLALRDRIYRPQDEALKGVNGRVTILDPNPLLCPHGTCSFAAGGKPVYVDQDHLSAAGRRLLLPMYRKLFERELVRTPGTSEG